MGGRRAIALLLCAIGLVGCFGPPEMDGYIAANEAMLKDIEPPPGARPTGTSHGESVSGESGPVVGYGTTMTYRLGRGMTVRRVISHYRRELSSWTLYSAGPYWLSYRRGDADIHILGDSVTGPNGQFTIGLDHGYWDSH